MNERQPGGAALAAAVRESYALGETDYSLNPLSRTDADGHPVGTVQDGDSVIFCCRRGEREIELTEAFTESDFPHFERPNLKDVHFSIMTMYHEKFRNLPIAFAPEQVRKPLAQVISEAGLTQFHCAESEKYAHVTFFLNGGCNQPFEGETDLKVPSPKGIPFDTQPELSLPTVAEKVMEAADQSYDFIVTNFANGDVIGHTLNTEAKLKAASAVSMYVSRVASHAEALGYSVLITADHGNIEALYTPEGKPHGAHTTNLVPFILLDPEKRPVTLRDGQLGDVAPTVLAMLGLTQPPEMTGSPLVTGAIPKARKLMLIILDGWGYGSGDAGDGIFLADTPEWDALLQTFPNSRLQASGGAVGLQDGKPGNSEAGHLNLGAGRIVLQDDIRMDRSLQDGSFQKNPVFLEAIDRAARTGKNLHLLAYLTKKSSHGCIDYPLMIARMAEGVKHVYFHIIFDGRSTPPGSAPDLLEELDASLREIGRGEIVGGVGRGIALDRDMNYGKIRLAYESMVLGNGRAYR